MPVSNNSVVHYTKNIENLSSILKMRAFCLKYCLETIDICINDNYNKPVEVAIPMVSFCDIPFTQIKKHSSNYGCYGIGLSKDWAIRRCLNPVVYLANNSWLKGQLMELYIHIDFFKQRDQDNFNANTMKKNRELCQLENDLTKLFCCVKNYFGDVPSRGIKNYTFYDEREWRFVAFQGCGLAHIIEKTRYEKEKETLNKKAKEVLLEFNYKDITYIILKTEKEVLNFIDTLEKYEISKEMLRGLIRKIITLEEIERDF